MASSIPHSPQRGSGGFQQVADAFLTGEGLPFAKILSAERIERLFAKHGCLFGRQGIYTSAIMVWSFLSQVLRDGKEASCQAAVARVVSYCEGVDIDSPTNKGVRRNKGVRNRLLTRICRRDSFRPWEDRNGRLLGA